MRLVFKYPQLVDVETLETGKIERRKYGQNEVVETIQTENSRLLMRVEEEDHITKDGTEKLLNIDKNSVREEWG